MGKPSYGGAIALSFIGGFLAAIVIISIIAFTTLRMSDAYGLGHWKLNVKMPLSTMWMNLGYWTDEEGQEIRDFETACANLLKQILVTAGLSARTQQTSFTSLAVLDLGFGCGDQTLELIRLTRPSSGFDNFSYVGLTLNKDQLDAASRNLTRKLVDSTFVANFPNERFELFCADAARPEAWGAKVYGSVAELADVKKYQQRWLLALDCLYHFKPSRKPVFEHAAKKLNANIMAFDLVLREDASTTEVLLARAIGVMMGCPFKTFLTEKQYRAQLEQCGYHNQHIIIKDISPHVFPGVVGFLDRQDRALSEYGISLGGYKLAGRLFGWFGNSGVLRASIVVAKTGIQTGEPTKT